MSLRIKIKENSSDNLLNSVDNSIDYQYAVLNKRCVAIYGVGGNFTVSLLDDTGMVLDEVTMYDFVEAAMYYGKIVKDIFKKPIDSLITESKNKNAYEGMDAVDALKDCYVEGTNKLNSVKKFFNRMERAAFKDGKANWSDVGDAGFVNRTLGEITDFIGQ